jgi:flagellar M-ring protein FliF
MNGLERLRELWLNTSKPNQMMLVGAVVAALMAGIVFVYWAGTPDYAPLVANASPSDASTIVNQLKDKKVPYRIDPNGTIEVPSSQRDELRMTMAGQGLLNSGSLGYGVLAQAPMGETQAMEQVRIRRAHEGELEKAIQSLGPVQSATVHFADADPNPFVQEEQQKASASILVHVRPGNELTKENVHSIVSLVKSGYSNLSDKNITLVDGEGRLRWDGARQADGMTGSDERHAQERRFEDDLTYKIQTHIKNTVGPGKSSVIVRAGLNLDKQTETKREITAGQKTSRSVSEETLAGGTLTAPRGQPGLASNPGGAAPGGGSTYGSAQANVPGNGKYTNSTVTETLAPGSTETHTVKAPGEVKYVYAAVSLDKSIPAETAAILKSEIETIIGMDPNAQDNSMKVSVDTVTFDKSVQEAAKKATQPATQSDLINKLINYGLPIFVMFVMLFILARSLKRPGSREGMLMLPGGGGMRHAISAAGAGQMGGQGGGELNMMVGDQMSEPMTLPESAPTGTKIIPVGSGQTVHTYEVIQEAFDANLESISHLARSKPEMVAQLIKSWMSEERRRHNG